MPIVLGRKPGGSGGGGAPSGPAGGDLTGTYPNPSISAQGSADGFVLTSDGAAGTAFERPPGYEFDYAQVTSNTTISNTVEASADTVVTGASVAYNGSTLVLIEFYAPIVEPGQTAGDAVTIILFEDGSAIGQLGSVRAGQVTGVIRNYGPVHVSRRMTPSNASHTYSIRAIRVGTNNGTIFGGAGGAGTRFPAYMRITKV